ncbi:hypothetical protein OROHE_006067 [Orobanche hederae]
MEERVDGKVSIFSEKVCFICRFVARTDDKYGKHGFYVFVVDLSELVGRGMKVLKPNFRLQFDIGMSVSAIGSTLYFTNALFENSDEIAKVYSLDILTVNQAQAQVVSAADFCTLPCMSGKKHWPLITSIPSTKKLLVFSSVYAVHRVFRGRSGYVHFEMFDVETNSWEELPQFDIQIPIGHGYDSGLVYFKEHYRYEICGYTLIDEGAVFLVHLSCGVKLTLNLDSAYKSWQLYNEDMVHSRILCMYPYGCGDVVQVPRSLHDENDPVKRIYFALTAIDGEDCVCVVRGGISKHSKHARVTLDVVNLLAQNLLASFSFVVEENKFKYFIPLFTFVYHHPK